MIFVLSLALTPLFAASFSVLWNNPSMERVRATRIGRNSWEVSKKAHYRVLIYCVSPFRVNLLEKTVVGPLQEH